MERKYRPEGYPCKYPGCDAKYPKPQSLGAHVTARHTRDPKVLEFMMGQRVISRKKFKEGMSCSYGCGEILYSPKKLADHVIENHREEMNQYEVAT